MRHSAKPAATPGDIDEHLQVGPRRRALGLLGTLGAAGGLLPVSGALSFAAAAPNANQQGITGAWYNPAQSGQGFVIEAYPDLLGNGLGLLFAGWFTFSGTRGGVGEQRWYSLSGEIAEGSSSITVTIYANSGGRFGTTPVTFAQVVGRGTLNFASCTEGSFAYNFNDGRSGTIPLSRLLANVACTDAGNGVDSELAFSGAWYDPATAGQGLVLELNPTARQAFVAWYTYAPDSTATDTSGQRWLSAQGSWTPGTRNFTLTLYSTSNGIFDNTATTTTVAIGQVELSFGSCNNLSWKYTITAGELAGKSGTVNMVRPGPSHGSCAFATTCALIPSETEGPYPLLSVLANPAIVRSDITEGKAGVPLTLVIKLVNINNNCAPIENSAVYIWHTDKDGVYSGYSGQPGGINATGQSFMRGVQTTNASGQVVFQTVYPGWYTGRITHIHFRAYMTTATSGNGMITSQIAFPPEITTAVYNSALYAGRGQNTSVRSFAEDGIFRDGVMFQLAQVAGNPSIGYVATLIVGVRV